MGLIRARVERGGGGAREGPRAAWVASVGPWGNCASRARLVHGNFRRNGGKYTGKTGAILSAGMGISMSAHYTKLGVVMGQPPPPRGGGGIIPSEPSAYLTTVSGMVQFAHHLFGTDLIHKPKRGQEASAEMRNRHVTPSFPLSRENLFSEYDEGKATGPLCHAVLQMNLLVQPRKKFTNSGVLPAGKNEAFRHWAIFTHFWR